jgi:hypothetical protein
MGKQALSILIFILFISNLSNSQAPVVGSEFVIENGIDSVFAFGGAYDSEKYLIIMRRELATGGAEIIGQFLSKADNSLLGNPIVLGETKIALENFEHGIPQVSFDGNRFIVVWTDAENGGIKYRFIDARTLTLSDLYSDATLPAHLTGVSTLHFNSSLNKYFLAFMIRAGSGYYPVGIFIRPDGTMENSFQISNITGRKEISLAYGNSRYLVCFVKEAGDYDNEVWGQIINENGSPVGSSFLIDGSPEPSDDPIFAVFDGAKFICFFPDEETMGWKTYARIVNPNGTVQSQRFLITSNAHVVPYAAVGNGELLFTCTGFRQDFSSRIIGRFFDLSLNPKSDEFTVFDTLQGKNPLVGYSVYIGDKYLSFTTRFRYQPTQGDRIIMTDGDVYGVTISPITFVKSDEEIPVTFRLAQNYPNPFNPFTSIRFSLPVKSDVKLEIFDIAGRKICDVVNGVLEAGEYQVEFRADNLASGIYIYKLKANSFVDSKKMILLK